MKALPAPSYFAPGGLRGIGEIGGGIEAVYDTALPHIFYNFVGGTIGGDKGSCCCDQCKIKL